ncbi:MAG: dihydropteroate synthase, partial [Candidatus Korarchaeum sp.]|nr:dihydropteroate synthase [Candidatus Korarchaeum sp.]MDW8036004.1 dihydropteroate synthase [Candidatus Korarchaeum sp.]
DVGGMSTAPYLETQVSVEEEKRRLVPAIKRLKDLGVPISVDTHRYEVVLAAVNAGATIVNDVSCLADVRIAELVASMDLSLILGARGELESSDPLREVRRLLKEGLKRASSVREERIILDPLIGFFRDASVPWYVWDSLVLRRLRGLLILGRPICIGVSRKSFIGEITGEKDPANRLAGSIAATTIAVYNGASLIRTHDVKETVQAVKVAEFIRNDIAKAKCGEVEAYQLTFDLTANDFEDIFLTIGSHPRGAELMSLKSELRVIYVRNVKNPVALVVKQEMLASGGEAALPSTSIVFGSDRVDLVIIGNLKQIRRLISKIEVNAREGSSLSSEFSSVKEVLSQLLK